MFNTKQEQQVTVFFQALFSHQSKIKPEPLAVEIVDIIMKRIEQLTDTINEFNNYQKKMASKKLKVEQEIIGISQANLNAQDYYHDLMGYLETFRGPEDNIEYLKFELDLITHHLNEDIKSIATIKKELNLLEESLQSGMLSLEDRDFLKTGKDYSFICYDYGHGTNHTESKLLSELESLLAQGKAPFL